MALTNLDAEALMQDARAMQAEGVRLIDAGDWRDGAEKGWLAVRTATAALVWDVTGRRNRSSSSIRSGLRRLARRQGGKYAELSDLWSKYAQFLHQGAFYDGVYIDRLPELVREVADYIRRAEELAGLPGMA